MGIHTQRSPALDPASHVWVSANAGSGKTSLLVSRILSLLLEGAAPSSILCLTYTSVAATEMRSRIQSKLQSWVTLSDSDLLEALRALLEREPIAIDLQNARGLFLVWLESHPGVTIETLHSFCQRLLTRYPLESGVQPQYRILDDSERTQLLKEAWKRLALHLDSVSHADISAEEMQKAFEHIAREFSSFSREDFIRKALDPQSKVLEFLEAVPHAERWQRYSEALDISSELSEQNLTEEYICHLPLSLLRDLSTLLAKAKPSFVKIAVIAQHILERHSAGTLNSLEDYIALFLTAKHEPRQRILPADLLKKMPHLAVDVATAQETLLRYIDQQNAIKARALTHSFYIVMEGVLHHLQLLKHQHSVVEYSELIRRATHLLLNPETRDWVRYTLDRRYDHVLVDESQDTSPEQWQLVQALTEEFFSGESQKQLPRSLFVVGDEKQSIYRFQGADPESYAKSRHVIAMRARDSGAAFAEVSLQKSYRSSADILHVVDHLFNEVQELRDTFTSDTPHIAHDAAHDFPGRVELWPLVSESNEEGDQEEAPSWDVLREIPPSSHPETILADHLAMRIRSWLDFSIAIHTRHEGMRAIQPQDILILLPRRTSPQFAAIVDALRRHQIPCSGLDRIALGEHLIVKDLLAALQFTRLPEDDYTLACLLKSPLIGFTDNQLEALCLARGSASLIEALRSSGKKDGAQDPAHRAAIAFLDRIYQVSHDTIRSPYALLHYILENLGGLTRFSRRTHQSEVEDVVTELLHCAMRYEQDMDCDIQGFLSWMQEQNSDIKREMGAGNHVRVMTIHGAKGLEAPIVFLLDIAGSGTQNEPLLLRISETPLLARSVAVLPRAMKRFYEARKSERDEESFRKLYVAMTRAEQVLILAGCEKKYAQSDRWHRVLSQSLSAIGQVEASSFPWKGDALYHGSFSYLPATSVMQPKEAVHSSVSLPAWFHAPVSASPSEAFSLQAHSHNNNEAASRGELIHHLLELISSSRTSLNLVQLRMTLPAEQLAHLEEAYAVVSSTLAQPELYALLTSPHAQREVWLEGFLDGNWVQGRVDLLIVDDARQVIHLIDYKSDRNPPATEAEIPEAYRQQLQRYKRLLKASCESYTITSSILWIKNATLQPLTLD